ncbi:MAG TPA: HlyD family efflux transporter periplasmic adaptor subunit [Thiotrichales bacterium]|nr:HlyD family efflux transporter periplasmic adaptor subunit [Thiotrichales bacterium]
MKKIIIVPFILLALVAAAVYYSQQQSVQQSDSLTLYGNVDIREIQLSVNASEHIAEVYVEEGDRVKKGQLLARLHTELLEAQLAEAQAKFLAQQQTLAKLKAGSRKEEIARARAEVAATKAEAKMARDSARRLQKLLPKKQASEDDVESALAKADAAKARAEAAEQSLALVIAGPRIEDIAIADAQLQAAKAQVALARQRLDDARLYAPADGVIRNRILDPGDMVFPQSAILTLALLDPVWVRAYVPETALGKIASGFKAGIMSDSFPGKQYEGWVGYISPTAEFTPKNVQTPELRTRLVYSIRVYACNSQNELRLGMPVTVTIPLQQSPGGADTHGCP